MTNSPVHSGISIAARVNISQKPAPFNHGIITKKIRAIVVLALIFFALLQQGEHMVRRYGLNILYIHHGDGGHLDDVFDAVSPLQDMHRFAHPHQDRPDRFGATQVVQQFVADVA